MDAITGELVEAVTNRLGQLNQSWLDAINKYSLMYEVVYSSGLDIEDVQEIDDETFINRIDYSMSEWDI